MFYRGEIIRDNEIDTTSSAAISRMKREGKREKERRKKAFILAQKSEALTEGDGDFTEEDRSAAEELFEQQEIETDKKNKFVSVFDLEESKQDTSVVESKLDERLIPFGKRANKVLGTDADNKLDFKDPLPDTPYEAADDGKVLQIVDVNKDDPAEAADYQFKKQFLKWI
tara:strand:- start:231 stop:740 length:510 start_codon:yes stop_codon:yes gene_type:complete